MAALSKIDVANEALVEHLGAKAIVSFDDGTTESKTVSALWVSVRDRVLREFPWSCLRERARLASEAGSAPAWGFTYGYPLPSDFIRLVSISDGDTLIQDHQYRLEKNTILYDESGPLDIVYIKDSQDDVDSWDSLLISYMAARLALACCKKINPDAWGQIKEDLSTLRYDAKRVNMQEGGNPKREEDSWIRVRRQG